MFTPVVSDLLLVTASLAVWFNVAVSQGFLIGYLTNAFSFRHINFSRQLGLAILFSMSVVPCFFNLLGLALGPVALLVTTVVIELVFLSLVFCQRKRFAVAARHIPEYVKINRIFLGACGVWLLLSIFMLVDVQGGERLFPSLMMLDHSAKVGIADEISRTGLPPANSTYFPGRLVPAFYHYYWTMLCQIIAAVCGSASDTRAAVLAGVSWSGFVLLNGIGFFASYFKTAAVSTRRVVNAAVVLPAVSNLYVLICLPLNVMAALMHYRPFKSAASICWWSADPIYPLAQTVFWAPHHTCGLIAGFLASTCMLEASKQPQLKPKICYALLAAACLSSCMGLSAYVAAGYALSWIAWAAVSLWQRRIGDFLTTTLTAFASLVITIPFLREMFGGAKGIASLIFAVRRFEIVDWFIPALAHLPKSAHQMVYLAVLPLNFVFGFGFLLLGAFYFWQRNRVEGKVLDRRNLFLIMLAIITITLSVFIRSRFNGNDFGWRVLLPGQLALLIWAAQFLAEVRQKKQNLHWLSRLAICIGVGSFAYAAYLDRTSPFNYMSGELSFCRRSVYEKLNKILPLNAVTQHNPVMTGFATDMYALLYSHRQVVTSEKATGGALNGADFHEYDMVTTNVANLFGNPTYSYGLETCRSNKINVLIVQDTDPVWKVKTSWLQTLPIIVASEHVRAYEILPPDQPVHTTRDHR